MGSPQGIGVSSEGYAGRAFACIRNCLRNVISEQNSGGLEALSAARLGGWAGATLLGHGFRIGMLAELVRDGLATRRRDIMRMGEREITVARRRLDRRRTEALE